MIAAILVITVFISGCASIVGQRNFPVTINSNPSGASYVVQDENGMEMFSGTTPTTISLRAGESYFHPKIYDIIFKKAGYADQHTCVRAEISGWYFGNFLFGGLIGFLIVDPLTGKMWKLPTAITTGNLTETTSSLNQPEKTLQITTLDQIPESQRKDLVRIR